MCAKCEDYTDRVDGFQIRDPVYLGPRPKKPNHVYDIVKWKSMEPTEMIDLHDGKVKTVTETCYTVAWLEWDDEEACFEFISCGLRWLEAYPSHEVIDMVLKFVDDKTAEINRENNGGDDYE